MKNAALCTLISLALAITMYMEFSFTQFLVVLSISILAAGIYTYPYKSDDKND